jgi:hypothetical protein
LEAGGRRRKEDKKDGHKGKGGLQENDGTLPELGEMNVNREGWGRTDGKILC